MDPDITLALVGAVLLALALLSTILHRILLSAVLVTLLLGVAVGPEGLGLLDPREAVEDERRLLEEVARVTLGVSVMAAGLQISRADMREIARLVAALLSVGMLGMWLATGLGAWLLLDLSIWAALLLGAILAPTDPVVASSLVTSRMATENVPRRLRRTLLAEAGANDGLALPFVLLGVAALTAPGPGAAASEWALESLRGIGIAVGLGAALGYGAGRGAELLLRRREIERSALLGTGLALSLLALGGAHLAGGSGILASFVAALAFSAVVEEHVREELDRVQETVSRVLILPAFLLLGTVLPWSAWRELGWAGVAFAAWAVILRRPPVVPLALARAGTDRRETAWLAWFGPLGIAAVYYATFVGRFDIPGYERIFAAATLAVCASVLVHSLTATPGVRWLARRRIGPVIRHPLRAGVDADP